MPFVLIASLLACSEGPEKTDPARADSAPPDEACNGVDDDGDGAIDEGLTTRWYLDADGDGYGGPDVVEACGALDGAAAEGGDCDDADPAVHPGATDTCADGLDQDCDGVADDAAETAWLPWY